MWSFDIYIGIRYRDKVSSEVGKGGGGGVGLKRGGGEERKRKEEETKGRKRKIKKNNWWPMPLFLIFISQIGIDNILHTVILGGGGLHGSVDMK